MCFRRRDAVFALVVPAFLKTDAAVLGPAPWWLSRLFIFARYSLRGRIIERLNNLIAGKLSMNERLFSSDSVVPKLFRVITQTKVAIMSYYLQHFAVMAHLTEQHCGFGSALSPEESHISPGG